MGFILLALGAALFGVLGLPGCQMGTPFAGSGYDRARGVTLPDVGETVVLGVTHAVAQPQGRAAFDNYTRQVIKSLPGNSGYIGHSVRKRILGNEVWTMTVWRDEAALEAFVRSPTHRAAMREGIGGVQRAKFLRVPWPAASVPPAWNEVLERLEEVEYVEYGDPEQ